jgi:hypothetical protein
MTRRTKRITSTGTESPPDDPVTTVAALGIPESTGAEPFHDGPVTTRVSYVDEPITVHSPTPGPVIMTVGWLADAEAKVIEPAEPPSPAPARSTAHTKSSRTRGRARDE